MRCLGFKVYAISSESCAMWIEREDGNVENAVDNRAVWSLFRLSIATIPLNGKLSEHNLTSY